MSHKITDPSVHHPHFDQKTKKISEKLKSLPENQDVVDNQN
jgi:hypothetical protein